MTTDPIILAFDKAKRATTKAIRQEIKAGGDVYDFSEMALSRRFAAVAAGRYAYDHSDRLWYVWRGSVWSVEEKGEAMEAIKAYVEAERKRVVEPKDSASMAKGRFAKSIEELSRSDPRLAVHHGMWDEQAWLLGTPGGTVDLKSGILRPSDPMDWMVRQTACAPAAPGTPAPLWDQFLAQATANDPELIAFLQRWCGYCLTGDISEEVLAFLYGDGGNGKGVLVSVLTAILGTYAINQPMEAFTLGSRTNGEYYRAQMAGARLVTASETEAGHTWAESQIKELTGNEAPISARQPHGRPFTYLPLFKLMFVGNHAPSLKSRSPAMERRLRIVPFLHKPTTPDPDLKDKLKAEYPAILRWMIEGCLVWQKARLGTAASISTASADYFDGQDALGSWMEERTIQDPSLSTKPGVLLGDFNSWAQANGYQAMTNGAFAEALSRVKGLSRAKSNGIRWIRGLGLKKTFSGDQEGM